MKKPSRKTPQSVKTQRKIDAAVDDAPKQQNQAYVKVKVRDDIEIEQLRVELEQASKQPTQIIPVESSMQLVRGSSMKLGFWVHNWQTGWKWFSNVAFAGIVAVQAFYDTLPPEVIMALPADTQSKITLSLAVLGLLGRFINQSKPKPLPPASDEIKEHP
ncbi:hypothetical protein PY247_18265 [Acinetobacter proteolyticus]|nr:hypothetical protein [Acinetobacter proteolyticus]WEI18190.1 hypothetical protein PY247_18265 [Acinetobacter proteolyticus]